MVTIKKKQVVTDITRLCGCVNIDIIPKQVGFVLGGISNLFIENINKDGIYKTETFDALATNEISINTILSEIQNSSGIRDWNDCWKIFMLLRITIRTYIQQNNYQKIEIEPLGKFKLKSLALDEYWLTYEDPAKDNYDKFLLDHQ